MTRKTSAEAFAKIQGILGGIQLEVYNHIYNGGPLTAGEIAQKMPQYQIDSVRNRPSELEKMGVIEVVGERICSITGFTAALWDVTAVVPDRAKLKAEKKKSRSELEAEIEELKKTCAELEQIAKEAVDRYEANNPEKPPVPPQTKRFEVLLPNLSGAHFESEIPQVAYRCGRRQPG